MAEITTGEVREYLRPYEGKIVNLDNIRSEFNIQRGTKSFDAVRNIMFQLSKQNVVKPTGVRPGDFKVLTIVLPVTFSLDGDDKEGVLDIRYPRSYSDDTSFGLEDLVEISRGDLILITGETNYGKTAIALSFLAENLSLLPSSTLMGSEYTSSDGQISPKLKRRLKRMDWAKWVENGTPRFKLLPVEHDYEDYMDKGGMTVIDWISLPGEYYLIDRVTKTLKNGEGDGIGVVVIQKNKDAEFAEGGQRSERYADLVLKIDRFGEFESLLRVGKVKAPKGRVSGRTWAFGITDKGANLENIREVVRCTQCWGRGYVGSNQNRKRCPSCEGRKFVNKEANANH